MRTIKLLTAATITAISISGFTMSAHADDTRCLDINEAFGTLSVMNALNEAVGLPGKSETSSKNKTLNIEKFDFKKLGSAQKDGDERLGKLNCNIKFQANATIFNTKKNKVVSRKNPTFVYEYDEGKTSQDELCYRFKSQTLQKSTAAKNIIPTDFCIPK